MDSVYLILGAILRKKSLGVRPDLINVINPWFELFNEVIKDLKIRISLERLSRELLIVTCFNDYNYKIPAFLQDL